MKRRGFTLIEVVVAFAILAVALAFLVSAGTRTLSRVEHARRMEAAGVLAQAKLAELALAGPPAEAEETPWAPLEATSNLGFPAWWRKRTAPVPVDPSNSESPTLRMLEVSIRLEDDPQAPVWSLSTLFPPTAVSGP